MEEIIEKEFEYFFKENEVDLFDFEEMESFGLEFDKYIERNYPEIWGNYNILSYVEHYINREKESVIEGSINI